MPVLLLRRNRNLEGDEPDPSPDPEVSAADLRLVITGEEDFAREPELEGLVKEKPGRYRVPAGHLLDQRFIEVAPHADLHDGDEPGTAQAGNVVPDRVRIAHDESGRIGLPSVVPEDVAQRFQERRLAIRAGSVKDEQYLLSG